jgi:hypothetical protein
MLAPGKGFSPRGEQNRYDRVFCLTSAGIEPFQGTRIIIQPPLVTLKSTKSGIGNE